MTDIFIKSFNRPFYLDRCLNSIENFVEGSYKITVLDDGTPQKYLDKISEKHPTITIKKSKNYTKKINAIDENLKNGTEINGFQIPTDLWIDAVKNGSDYFIITEDDVWFTKKINTDELQEIAKKNKISLLKLGWLGNHQDDKWINLYPSLDNEITALKPKNLFLSNPFIMDLFFYNKLKFFSLGYKLGFFDNYTKKKYWILNSILMGFWQKDYWLFVWKDATGKVDEPQQLMNASIYYKKHQNNPCFISRLNKEKMKTTFQSSSTNSYHKYGNSFDVNLFNHLINEAWYRGDFDSMENFPKDFSSTYLESFISEKINVEEFRIWVKKFKNQYRELGCDVE